MYKYLLCILVSFNVYALDYVEHYYTFFKLTNIMPKIPVVEVDALPYFYALAQCVVDQQHKAVEIRVTKDFVRFYGKNFYAVEEMILHELGHCVLGRYHNEITFPFMGGNLPESIMHPILFLDLKFYKVMRKYYFCEFIGGRNCKKLIDGNEFIW